MRRNEAGIRHYGASTIAGTCSPNQTGFEGGRVDRCACSDFGWLLLLADDRSLSYDCVYAVVIGFVVSIGVFVISLYMDRRLGPGRSRISHRD